MPHLLTKGIQMWTPTRSLRFVCVWSALITGDDVKGRKQPVHLEIKDRKLTAARKDPAAGRKGRVSACAHPQSQAFLPSQLRGEGEVFITGNFVTASSVPSKENPTSHNLTAGQNTGTGVTQQPTTVIKTPQVPQAGLPTCNPIQTS